MSDDADDESVPFVTRGAKGMARPEEKGEEGSERDEMDEEASLGKANCSASWKRNRAGVVNDRSTVRRRW